MSVSVARNVSAMSVAVQYFSMTPPASWRGVAADKMSVRACATRHSALSRVNMRVINFTVVTYVKSPHTPDTWLGKADNTTLGAAVSGAGAAVRRYIECGVSALQHYQLSSVSVHVEVHFLHT
ncbi:hypothetical protein J6590_081961 [Homalodisca vitripennis]|nr:hypothetical protein J6590_081961 [Homalodisca vitripennis]